MGRLDIPQDTPKHSRLQLFYRTFSPGHRTRSEFVSTDADDFVAVNARRRPKPAPSRLAAPSLPVGDAGPESGHVSTDPDDFVEGGAWQMPEQCYDSDYLQQAARLGANWDQVALARELERRGLLSKARRLAFCCVLGGRMACRNAHRFWQRWRCGYRFCPNCARSKRKKLVRREADKLSNVVDRVRSECNKNGQACVVHRVELTAAAPATAEEIRKLNQQALRLLRGKTRKEQCAVLWQTDVQDGRLHLRAAYVGPPMRDAAARWSKIAGAGASITIERAGAAEAVKHVLTPPGPLASDPRCLAEAEAASTGVRQLHAAGMLFGAAKASDTGRGATCCPICSSPLERMGQLEPVATLLAEGIEELGEVRRALAATGPPGAEPDLLALRRPV